MSKPVKLIFGVLSFTPIVLLCYALFEMLNVFGSIAQAGGGVAPSELAGGIAGAMEPWTIGLGISVVMMLCCLAHLLSKDKRGKGSESIVWAVCLVIFNVVSVPVYWYVRIWSEPEPPTVGAA